MPPAAVYFVKPLRMAAMPASLTGTGVSKSGSPEAKSITSTPRAAIALASAVMRSVGGGEVRPTRSEEHTAELQSRLHLVCRLFLEKKKKNKMRYIRCSVNEC